MPLSDNLLNAWRFSESGGSTSADEGPAGKTLTTFGTATLGSGLLNLAALGDRATLSSSQTLSGAGSWSVAWRGKQTSSGNNGVFAGNGTAGSFLWMQGGGGGGFTFKVNNTYKWTELTSFTTDANYVLVYDQPGSKTRLYKDGTLVSEKSLLGSESLIISRVGSGYTSDTFSLVGSLDYFYTWDRLLDATDIADIHADPDSVLAAAATSYTFTGPMSGDVNVASTNFTVTPDGDADGITVTPASDGSGTFTPTSVTFSGSSAKTFTYTPTSTTGSPHTLSVTDDGGLTDPASIDYTVNSGAATSYTFTGPTSGIVNVASTNFTVTPNGTSSATVTPASDGAGTFTPSTVTFDGTAAAKTFTYTPTSTTGSPHTLSTSDDGGLTDPATIDYTVSDGSISCTDLTAGRIYQRAAGTTAKTISFGGAYTGATPASVEIKIVAQDDAATIQDWTEIGSPTIAGGTWSGTLSVPQGGEWYNFLARSKDGSAAVLNTSSQTSNKWGVGILIVCAGQSNMTYMFTVSSTPPASSDFTRQYDRTNWAVVPGNGAIRLANLVFTNSGLLTGLLQTHASGTAIGSAEHVNRLTEALNETGDDCEFMLWHQGESDAIAGTVKATYKSALDSLYSTARTLTGRTTGQLKFGVALLGNISDGTATDATTDAIRKGQQEWIAETTGAFFSGSSVDMVRTDAYHWTAPYYERMGRRYAQAIANQLGQVAFGSDGPVVSSALRASGSADIRITVTHDGGTAIEEIDGSTDGGSLTGWLVSDDDFATTLTISSTSFSAGKIVLTLSAVPADIDTIKVRYQYGENPTITNPVYDDTVPQSDTIGLPLQPAEVTVTVTSLPGGNTDLWYRLIQIARDNGLELIEQ